MIPKVVVNATTNVSSKILFNEIFEVKKTIILSKIILSNCFNAIGMFV